VLTRRDKATRREARQGNRARGARVTCHRRRALTDKKIVVRAGGSVHNTAPHDGVVETPSTFKSSSAGNRHIRVATTNAKRWEGKHPSAGNAEKAQTGPAASRTTVWSAGRRGEEGRGGEGRGEPRDGGGATIARAEGSQGGKRHPAPPQECRGRTTDEAEKPIGLRGEHEEEGEGRHEDAGHLLGVKWGNG